MSVRLNRCTDSIEIWLGVSLVLEEGNWHTGGLVSGMMHERKWKQGWRERDI